MNPLIKKLADLSEKKSRRIIGLMSGTSLDGLDIALCEIQGDGFKTKVQLEEFVTVPYSKSIIEELKKITSVEDVKLREVSYWHTRIAQLHGQMILDSLKKWKINSNEIDCIASHGQTIYHYPARDQSDVSVRTNTTLQIGDGDHIASKTGIVTLSDFRQKHVAHGGEGAPMAGLVDLILFTHPTENRIMLNIGGIANYTYLPSQDSEMDSFTTDTGPGNTLIDSLMRHYYQKPYDADGEVAFSGNLDEGLLQVLLEDQWFAEKETKTTGPEYFNIPWFQNKMKLAGVENSSADPADLIRTASELSANTIADNIVEKVKSDGPIVMFVSGGGAHNSYVMKRINEILPQIQIKDISELGMSADAKEAILFAVLANEMIAGEGFEMETSTGKSKVNFGKISFPI